MMREQIKQMDGMTICFEDVSRNGDDWLVVGIGNNTYMILRNQGEHDRRFFLVGHLFTNLEEAIAKAKYFCNR